MIADSRHWYNHYSTHAAVYSTVACMIVGLVTLALHISSWLAGADVGFFDNPALATALRPLMAAMILPAIGLLVGHVAHMMRGHWNDDRNVTLGLLGGQLAAVVAILPAIHATQANLAAMVA